MKVYNAQQVIETTGLVTLIYGEPGIGKTTLANSSPKPILLDFDRGAHRASFGKTVVQFDSWQDMINSESELNNLIEESETVIIDTAGTLLDLIQSHLVDTQPMLAKNSIKLWGELKKVFTEYFTPLKRSGKNIVFIAHSKEKEEGDIRIKRPLIQGSSYDLLMQSCDLIGFYSMKNNRRVLTFDISDTVVAKNCAGIEPIEITDLNFASNAMTHIIEKTRGKLVNRLEEHQEAIDKVQTWISYAETAEPSIIYQALVEAKFKKTEKTSIWAGVTRVLKERGYAFNEETKQFEHATVQQRLSGE
jgi:hypothetical protein